MKAGIQPRAEIPSALPGLLSPQREAPGAERLAVYTEGYLARMQQALAEVYEAVRHVVGRRAFADLSRAYAGAFPSHEYNLSFAGRHLPAFLASAALTRELPFLPDLAQLDWLVCQAFHAHEQPAMSAHALALPEGGLEAWAHARLILQPSMGLVASPWPIRDIWAARHQPVAQVTIDLVDRPQHVLIARQGLQVRCDLLEPAAFALLQALHGGRPLGEALQDVAMQWPRPGTGRDESEPPVMSWFATWAGAGIVVRVERPQGR